MWSTSRDLHPGTRICSPLHSYSATRACVTHQTFRFQRFPSLDLYRILEYLHGHEAKPILYARGRIPF